MKNKKNVYVLFVPKQTRDMVFFYFIVDFKSLFRTKITKGLLFHFKTRFWANFVRSLITLEVNCSPANTKQTVISVI